MEGNVVVLRTLLIPSTILPECVHWDTQPTHLQKIRLREKLGATRRDPILPLKKYQQAVGNLCVQDAEREPVGRPATGQHIVLNVAFPRVTTA